MTALGHVLRGGTPSAYDRVIATRFGIEAIDAAHESDYGKMVALRGTDVVRVSIEDGVDTVEDRRRPPVRDRSRLLRIATTVFRRGPPVASPRPWDARWTISSTCSSSSSSK